MASVRQSLETNLRVAMFSDADIKACIDQFFVGYGELRGLERSDIEYSSADLLKRWENEDSSNPGIAGGYFLAWTRGLEPYALRWIKAKYPDWKYGYILGEGE